MPDKKKREGPTWLPMGIEKEMLVRLQRPLKQELNHLYNKVYRGLPKPGLGPFIAFCASLGMDVVREKYLPALPGQEQQPANSKETAEPRAGG